MREICGEITSLRMIAKNVPVFSIEHTTPWDELNRLKLTKEELREIIRDDSAKAIARGFAEKVKQHLTDRTHDELRGKITRFDCIAMTYDELMEVLFQAYCQGVRDLRTAIPGDPVLKCLP